MFNGYFQGAGPWKRPLGYNSALAFIAVLIILNIGSLGPAFILEVDAVRPVWKECSVQKDHFPLVKVFVFHCSPSKLKLSGKTICKERPLFLHTKGGLLNASMLCIFPI